MSLTLSQRATNISPSITLNLTGEVARMRAQGLPVISLGAGEPDFDTPVHIADAAVHALREGKTRYTDVCGIPALREALAAQIERQKSLTYSPDEILVGAGAKQVLYEALCAIVNPGDEVLLPVPYWLSYPEMIRMAGGTPVMIPPEKDFLPDPCALEAAFTPRTKALIINTPNNPSGAVWPRPLLERVMAWAQSKNIFVISDEIYENLLHADARHISPAAISPDAHSRTVVISGFSKSYAMTGWRVGYAAGPKHVIAAMAALQSHASGSVNTPAQYAALAAVTGPQDCVSAMAAAFSRRRKLFLSLLSKENLSPAVLPQGAFYLLLDVQPFFGKQESGKIIDSDLSFAQSLLSERLVATVPGTPFGAAGFLRLSYAASEEDIARAAARIGAFVRSLK